MIIGKIVMVPWTILGRPPVWSTLGAIYNYWRPKTINTNWRYPKQDRADDRRVSGCGYRQLSCLGGGATSGWRLAILIGVVLIGFALVPWWIGGLISGAILVASWVISASLRRSRH